MGVNSPTFNQALIPLQKHISKADELRDSFGRTDLYSTGSKQLDEYLGGGFGRKNSGYEMVLIYGPSGSGKSLLGLNMMLDPILKGLNVGLMVLEDEPADVVNRMRVMTDGEIDNQHNVFFADEQNNGYTLEQALTAIEEWFSVCDIVLLDHLEYLFAGSVGESERNQFQKQEVWMRHLNGLMKRTGKTIVMIQHVNKSNSDGVDKIKGSSAFVQTCSKVIEMKRNTDGNWSLKLQKTRFTPFRSAWFDIGIDRFKLKEL